MSALRALASGTASLAMSVAILAAAAGVAPAQTEKAKEKAAPPTSKRIDLNSATVEQLETLPGIGPVLAKKIVDGRPYKAIEGLSKSGVSEAEIAKIRPLVEVSESPKPKAEPEAAKVDLNTADEAAFVALPGIGPALAKAIIDGRPYPNVDQLRRVKGLGQAKFDAIKDLVKVSSFTPVAAAPRPAAGTKKGARTPAKAAVPPGTKVNINTATLAELDVLPGIGPARAQAIIDARPFEKPEDVMKVKGIKEVEYGKIKDLIVVK